MTATSNIGRSHELRERHAAVTQPDEEAALFAEAIAELERLQQLARQQGKSVARSIMDIGQLQRQFNEAGSPIDQAIAFDSVIFSMERLERLLISQQRLMARPSAEIRPPQPAPPVAQIVESEPTLTPVVSESPPAEERTPPPPAPTPAPAVISPRSPLGKVPPALLQEHEKLKARLKQVENLGQQAHQKSR